MKSVQIKQQIVVAVKTSYQDVRFEGAIALNSIVNNFVVKVYTQYKILIMK